MKRRIVIAIISGILFLALIYMLGSYDVAAIGPAGTEIGFSHINQSVHELTGENITWYVITDYLGYLALLVCAVFALTGLVQMIKRRSLAKVNRTIYALGGLYIVVIGLYVFFEKFIVNYRPVIMPGESSPEASFPSSHTMLIVTVMISTAMVIGEYIKNKGAATLVKILCILLTIITVCGRLYCGVHWLTDIIGGILLSISLIEIFSAVLSAAKRADQDMKAGYSGASTRGYVPKH